MKKFSLMVMIFFVATSLFAQGKIKLGIKAGLNMATLTSNIDLDNNFKPGANFGLLGHIHFTPAFSLQPEVYYSNQGTKYPTVNGVDYKLILNYVNIPLLLQYNFDNGFRLQGGPQLGILTEAKNKAGSTEIDASNAIKNIDFSIPLGFSYLGYSGFGADVRYNIGVTTINDQAGATTKLHNGVIQLGVFYMLDHRHKAKSK